MAIIINGKVYRNLQEQVGENAKDIEDIQTKDLAQDEAISEIQEALPYKQDKLTAGDNITIEDNVISATGGSTYTAGSGIVIDNDEISVDTDVIPILNLNNTFTGTNNFENVSTKVFTALDATITKQIHDDTNPQEFKIKMPISYNGSIELDANMDDNSHPSDSDVRVYADRVTIGSYNYNHGPDDDTNIGYIEVNDSGVTLQSADYEYKTELVLERDELYVKYYDLDPSDPSTTTWGLVEKCFQVDSLINRHLYAHNIQLSVKFKSQGVTSNDYTGRINFTLYTTTLTQFDETSLKAELFRRGRISATGYAIDTSTSTNYTIIAINKYGDLVSTDIDVDLTINNSYAASGYITSNIGEITAFTDKVVAIY